MALSMAGATALAAGINAGTGFLNSRLNSYEEYLYNEKAAENAMKRNANFYIQYNSPKALMEQYKAAGLAPEIVGTGGVGGGTGQSQPAGGISGQTATNNLDLVSTLLQLTQKKNIEADTQVKEAEASKIKQDTKKSESETNLINEQISKTIAETNNLAARTRLTDLQSDWQDITNFIQTNTINDNLAKIHAEALSAERNAEKFYWEAKNEKLQFDFNEATFDAGVKKVSNEATLLLSQTLLNYSQKEEIDTRIPLIEQEFQLKVNQWLLECDKLDWDKDKTDKYLNQQLKIFREEQINKYNWEKVKTKVELTEFKINMTLDIIKSLIAGYGMYSFGAMKENPNWSQTRRNIENKAYNEARRDFERDYEYTR